MPRAALTCGCFYQSLPSVPSQSIDDALSELRSYMSTPRRQSVCGAFSCIARSCRRFHDAVHPASMNRDTMLRQTSSPRRLGAGPEGGAGTTADSLSTPSSAPRRDLNDPGSIGDEDFAVQGHDALLSEVCCLRAVAGCIPRCDSRKYTCVAVCGCVWLCVAVAVAVFTAQGASLSVRVS